MEKEPIQKDAFISLTEEEQRIRTYLIDFAHKAIYEINPYVSYGYLCNECCLNLDMSTENGRAEIGCLLDSVSTYEIRNNRPVLSSLVVTTRYEFGDGFYKLCAEEFPELGSWKKQKKDRVDVKMTEKCVKYWNNEAYYGNYREYKAPTNVKEIVLNSEEQNLRDVLINAASKGETLFYSDLISETNDYLIGRLTKMLERISHIEFDQEKTFLCALLINKSSRLPGAGFYELCANLKIEKSVEELQQECFDRYRKK